MVDDDDQTVEKDILGREIAAPTLGGLRSILSSHPSQGIDPARLSRILRDAEYGNADAYYDLAQLIEEKYLHYRGVLGARKRAVTQLPITVNAAGDDARAQKDADLLRSLFRSPALKSALMDILDAIGKGFSVQELVWDTTKRPWLPVKIINRNQKWFEFDQIDGETLRLRGGEDGMAGMATDLPNYKFLIHRHKDITGPTVRGGLARGVAWAWLFQNMSIKDWVIFAEVYGMPLRLGKYDASATEEDKRKLLRAVVGIGTDTAGIIPKSMEMEFVNGVANGNADVWDRLITMLDQQVSKAVLGQTGTTDATTGGFGSSGAVHNDVREDIQRADAEALAATLSQLGQWIIDLNHGPPPSGQYPEVNLGEDEFFTIDDMAKIERFVEMGGDVEISVVRDKLGLPDPDNKTSDGKAVRLLKPKSLAATMASSQADADAQEGVGGAQIAKRPNGPSEAILNHLKTILNSEPPPVAASELVSTNDPDAIDDMMDDLGDAWSMVETQLLGSFIKQTTKADDSESLKAGLISIIEGMDNKSLTELLARVQYNTRLAGEAGLDLGGDEQ